MTSGGAPPLTAARQPLRKGRNLERRRSELETDGPKRFRDQALGEGLGGRQIPSRISRDIDDERVGIRVEERDLLIELLQGDRCTGRRFVGDAKQSDPHAVRYVGSAQEEM